MLGPEVEIMTNRFLTSLVLTALLAPAVLAEPPRGKEFPAPGPDDLIPLGEPVKEEKQPQKVDPELRKQLAAAGFVPGDDGSLTHSKSGTKIKRHILEKAGIKFDGDGKLVYVNNPEMEVEAEHLKKVLKGISEFGRAAAYDPKAVGKTLSAWGVPAAYDGVHLMNPDGSATYFGLMLYDALQKTPDKVNTLSQRRLAKAITLFQQAHSKAFGGEIPDVAAAWVGRARSLLTQEKLLPGEKPVNFVPVEDGSSRLERYRATLDRRADLLLEEAEKARKAGRSKTADRKEAEADRLSELALELSALKKKRYHKSLSLKEPPAPVGIGGGGGPGEGSESDDPVGKKPDNAEPRHKMLPRLLSALQKHLPRGLTEREKEAFIKSFPLGESVWRMRADKLWEKGYTGKEVRVAVFDTGVANSPQLKEHVVEHKNFTGVGGPRSRGKHGTHVAGTIAALAPDAEIRSYQIRLGQTPRELNWPPEKQAAILKSAIDRAVKDGNTVFNMSWGYLNGPPSSELTDMLTRYAKKKGIHFVVSAGNEGKSPWTTGLRSPSTAKGVLSIGASTVNGALWQHSSYGASFDPVTMGHAVKRILVAPGHNIRSTIPSGPSEQARYDRWSGTSMAAPHVAGMIALYRDFTNGLGLDPVTAARRVEEALWKSGVEYRRDQMPYDTPPEQRKFRFDPTAAFARLWGSSALVKGK
jgi:subtilisin family serine protease